MDEKAFRVLRELAENFSESVSSDSLALKLQIPQEQIQTILQEFKKLEFIDANNVLLQNGFHALEPYKVQNAIILAAGMSTRFAPVSYELPKGLISVKGEVMVERLIRQLTEAGVKEIVLVVGYMLEKFLYLRDKYEVKFVINNEFNIKNTHSSIYAARDYLSNTYILCSDNYYPKNMFHTYEFHAFYTSIYTSELVNERALIADENGKIVETNKPAQNQWIMYGHAYYNREFTEHFKPFLAEYYRRPGNEYMYWEMIYAEHIEECPMWITRCREDEILEFDSMDELKQFDPDYIANNRIKVFENICRILCCDFSDIKDIKPITKGLNNKSFQFSCNGKKYIYRHPGTNAVHLIDRKKESKSLRMVKRLQVDNTLVYMDEEEGWKISHFVETTEDFSFHNPKHRKMLAEALRQIHHSKECVGFSFDFMAEADKLLDVAKYTDVLHYRAMMENRKKVQLISGYLKQNPWQVSLCHNDIYEPNLLVHKDKLILIDWEFAGDNDIGYDICKLFATQNPIVTYEEADEFLFPYFGRKPTEEEKIHLFSCAALIYYYWYIWGIHVSKNSSEVADYILSWYDKMQFFSSEVLRRIEN